jgi:hypothetical protein
MPRASRLITASFIASNQLLPRTPSPRSSRAASSTVEHERQFLRGPLRDPGRLSRGSPRVPRWALLETILVADRAALPPNDAPSPTRFNRPTTRRGRHRAVRYPTGSHPSLPTPAAASSRPGHANRADWHDPNEQPSMRHAPTRSSVTCPRRRTTSGQPSTTPKQMSPTPASAATTRAGCSTPHSGAKRRSMRGELQLAQGRLDLAEAHLEHTRPAVERYTQAVADHRAAHQQLHLGAVGGGPGDGDARPGHDHHRVVAVHVDDPTCAGWPQPVVRTSARSA